MDNIIQQAIKIRDHLKSKDDFTENPIDLSYNVIPPFTGKSEIKLIIVGQDPTFKESKSRRAIKMTLNLDKSNSLTRYVSGICKRLGISLDNVYATNIFKYFYTVPPARTMDVLSKHLNLNIGLVRKEIADYNSVPVITLGEPVLELIANESASREVRFYWGYDDSQYHMLHADENILKRELFPFPHQPSISKVFYRTNIERYIKYMHDSCKIFHK